ncbi:MAG TPA: presqualene diphosphate synthase HpnD [Dehalococcoidia bacterium]|jgi:phytoene synthase|nr:presqualene diphosphate synthase HpnD [Dehalococcoidia bacterium]
MTVTAAISKDRKNAVALADAYAWCKAYTRERAKNFYYAFAILPRDKRNAIYAAYAFSGHVDDIADELTERSEQERQLAEARARLRACYEGEREGPLFTALGDAIDRFEIPASYFEGLIDGVEMDFTINRYGTWEELHRYCYRVASMVGLVCTSIFGTKPHPEAERYAVDLGVALQMVNIMRDVREDAERGRVYFPKDELASCGLTPEDILACRYDERFVALMLRQGERAHTYFASGRRLLPLLDLRSRMCVNVLQGVYAEILKRIEARRYDVLSARVSLSGKEKLAAIARLWAGAVLVRPT